MKSLSSVLPFYQGVHGGRGGSKNCYGANGASVYVKVSSGCYVSFILTLLIFMVDERKFSCTFLQGALYVYNI